MNFRFLLLFLIPFLSFTSQAAVFEINAVNPPDSTTKLIDKSSAFMMIEEGKRLFSEGKMRDALSQFRQAALKDPNSWKPIYWIGECHYAMSNFGFALKYASEALKNNAADVEKEVYFLLGKSYHHLGKLDSAITNYQFALTYLTPNRSKELGVAWKINQCKFAKNALEVGEKSKPAINAFSNSL